MADMASREGVTATTTADDACAVEPPAAVDVAMLVAQIGEASESLAGADLDSALDDQLAEALVELLRAGSRLDAVIARVATRVEASKVWARDGSKSCAAWLGRAGHRAKGECAATLRRGRSLRSMPHVDAAHRRGRLSARHVEWFAKAAATAPENFAIDEQWLVARGVEFRFDDFVCLVRHWMACAAPDDAESDAVDRYRRRAVHLSGGLDGTGFMDVAFEPIGREIVTEALARLEHELWEHDWADARARLGARATTSDLARSDAQRRYDALVEMARRSVAAPPGAQKPRPLITALVGTDTLARMCELSTGTIVTPGEVLPLLCDCDIERAVFDAESRVVDVGVTRRFFAGATRRAVEILGGRCEHPTCDTPAHRCDVHHIVEHEHGGETIVANGELLCPRHHRHQHDEALGREARRKRAGPTGPSRRRMRTDDHLDDPGDVDDRGDPDRPR